MHLSNAKFQDFKRQYDLIRQENQAKGKARLEEVQKAIPNYSQYDALAPQLTLFYFQESLKENPIPLSDYLADYKSKIKKTESYQKKLLAYFGYPADYLDPIYTCEDCKDFGLINNQKCHCFISKIIKDLYHQSNLELILEEENFSKFSFDYYDEDFVKQIGPVKKSAKDNAKEVFTFCKLFVDEFKTNKRSLLLYGNVGTGKTFATNCIAKELMDQGYSVLYYSASDFFDKTTRAKFSKLEETEVNIIPLVLSCDLLIIDDLGTEFVNSITSSIFFEILNQRLLSGLSIILSTNLSIGDLKDTYSDRILSRLSKYFVILNLFGEDIRLKKRTLQKTE